MNIPSNLCSRVCSFREGNGTPLQYSCLENPRDGGAWWAAVYGVAQSRTQLKWLSSSSSRKVNTQPPSLPCLNWETIWETDAIARQVNKYIIPDNAVLDIWLRSTATAVASPELVMPLVQDNFSPQSQERHLIYKACLTANRKWNGILLPGRQTTKGKRSSHKFWSFCQTHQSAIHFFLQRWSEQGYVERRGLDYIKVLSHHGD